MRTLFSGARVAGLLGVLPGRRIDFADEAAAYPFPLAQTLRLQRVMGYGSRRVVREGTTPSDLCRAGMERIFREGWARREEIAGLIVATSCPDQLIPPVSSLLHGALGLPREAVCLDLSQGCTGFLTALIQGLMLLPHVEGKVLAASADVLSRRTSPQDRNSAPLTGDGAGLALLEKRPGAGEIRAILYNDGSRGDALQIPAGGSRLPSSPETAARRDMEGDGNLRALDHLSMKGTDVFSFVQTEVPPLVEEALAFAGWGKEDPDWYLFHQPNRFMLEQLRRRLGLPREKVPMDLVEAYGNSGGACIPILAAKDLAGPLLSRRNRCCLAAFGSGLSWGSVTLELGPLDFCALEETEL